MSSPHRQRAARAICSAAALSLALTTLGVAPASAAQHTAPPSPLGAPQPVTEASGETSAARPTISGTAQVGRTLVADPGYWGPDPVEFTYEWHALGFHSSWASDTYTVHFLDVGRPVSVSVTGTWPDGSTETRVSAASEPVIAGEFETEDPVVVGTPRVGDRLTVDLGTWTPRPSPFRTAYQWIVEGEPVKNATHPFFIPQPGHKGQRISVRVTVREFGYTTATVTSDPTRRALPARAVYSDVQDEAAWYYRHVYWMQEEGITAGYADGTFKPRRNITRGEVAAFLQRLRHPDFESTDPARFPDVPVGHTFFDEVGWAVQAQVIRGYSDGTFRPGRPITRGETATMVLRMAQLPTGNRYRRTWSDLRPGQSHYEAAAILASYGAMSGYQDETFQPQRPITRAELAKVLSEVKLEMDATG